MVSKHWIIPVMLLISACAPLRLPDLDQAKAELEQGNVEGAQTALESLVEYDLDIKERVDAYNLLAKINRTDGDAESALNYFRKVVAEKPGALKDIVSLLNRNPELTRVSDCDLIKNNLESPDAKLALFLSKGVCPGFNQDKWVREAARKGEIQAMLALAAGSAQDRALATNLVFDRSGRYYTSIPRLASIFNGLRLQSEVDDVLARTQSLKLTALTAYKLAAYQKPAEALETYRNVKDSVPKALLAIMRVALRNPAVVTDNEYREILAQALKDDTVKEAAVLVDATNYTWGHRGVQDPQLALQALTGLEEHHESKYLRGQIYRYGFLGLAYPTVALKLLNDSASKGNSKAWTALAEIYEQGRIVCEDRQLAQIYRRIASQY